jgi:hypothetical protein
LSDRAVEPDHVVRTAIQLLPTPDHGDHFWSELEARLDAEPARVATAVADRRPPVTVTPTSGPSAVEVRVLEPVALAPLGVVPPAFQRRSNVVLSAVAVAAAVLVVVAGTTLVRQREDGGTTTADLAAGTVSSTSVSVTTSVKTLTGPAAQAPTDAVLAWLAALGEGDTDAAWEAMGPASRDHFGSASAFAAESSALAEGYGAWSAVEPDDVIVTPLVSGGQLVVVTLVGEVDQEGTRQRRADAFPVRMSGGEAVVEPWAFAGELEMVVPYGDAAGGELPVVADGDELVIVIPRGVQAPTIRLDDEEPMVCGEAEGTDLSQLEGAPGQRCSYHPDGGLPEGRRVLTVAFLSPDGDEVTAESVLFEAA